MKNLALLLVVLLVSTAMAVPRNGQRIVGGDGTTIQTYPFMASMHYGWNNVLWGQACGGALITRTTVLSASHCYYGDSASSWRVQVGSSYPESGGTIIAVSQIVTHEEYDSENLNNDVAIVRLAEAAVLGTNVGTALIAGPNYRMPDNTPLYTVGWGTLSSGGTAATILQHVEIYTISQQTCIDRYAYLKTQPGYENWPDITDGMLCCGVLDQGGKDACQGDSGGPVVHNGNVVYGITSWGFGCGDEYYPGVNAYVPYYADWIVANGST